MGGGILVIGETLKNRLTPATLELLKAGRGLADALQNDLIGLFIGLGVGIAAAEAVHYGADKVLAVENSDLERYQPELYLAGLEKVCKGLNPAAVLLTHNSIGADLAPRIAFRLGTGLTTDCLDLGIDPETRSLLCTKPIYGGNVMAVYTNQSKPPVATIREKAFPPARWDEGREGEIISYDLDVDCSVKKIDFIEKVADDIPGVKLEEADVIVCGGRGIGDPDECDGVAQLYELAAVLGGAVAGSRPVCEKGWLHPRLQVGLTGKKVTPKIYIAVGVSGASQHLAGMLGAKTIVAINSDPKANIFKECHYSGIGDYREILPAFTKKVKELLNSN